MKKFSGFAKILIIIFLTLSISGSVFIVPQKAEAQVTTRLEAIVDNIWEKITTVADKISLQVAATAFKTALSQFLNKMAYDMAVAVATGAPGQKSLIFDDPNYFLNLGDAVMGNAIDDIAQSSGFTNILGTTSLCEPIDLTFKVNLLLSFKKPTEPAKPRCSLSQINKALAESADSFKSSFSLQNLSLRFEMGDLEEARNSLRQALTVEKYLHPNSSIYVNFNTTLTNLENISDDLSELIQRIYQKPIAERQAAAEGELKNLSDIQTQLILTQNRISQIQEMINDCGAESGNCTEIGAAGVCQNFIALVQPNCSAAVSTAQTYHGQFQKLETDLTDGMNNLYTGILEKAFTAPEANDPKDITNAFNPEANPMGQYFLIKEAKDNAANVKIENEKLLQRISKDCEPKKDPVSGMNVLPSSAACGMFNFAMTKSTVNEGTYTGIFSQAVSIFTNTLAGKLLQKWFEEGVANLYDKGKGKNSSSAADLSSSGAPRGQTAAEEKFLTLLQSNFTAGGPFEVLKELTICPEQGAGPNNCAIDPDFSQAIAERLTLKEAMDKKLLDPKKPFGYIKSGGILVEPSFLNGYPYRSMIVLRKFRIIPVGWELAAEWIKDQGKNTNKIPYTLKQVVDCYENTSDCVFDVNNGEPNPFYHLVDPGWVFLEQPAFCKRQGAGEKILAEEFICSRPDTTKKDGSCLEYSRNVYRQEYCADEQTCLAKNDDGSCRFYGYCSEEIPSWKLDGNSCNQEMNSCQTYGNKDGVDVSYLEHSISSGGCNAGNAGCQWYCEQAPLICSGGTKNGEPCSDNNDCAPVAGGIADGVCKPTDLWKCQGKNLIGNGGMEVNSTGWTGFGTGVNNWISSSGHESFASLSSSSSGAESGWQSLPISFYSGESMDASGWINVSVAGGGASIRLRNLTTNTIIAESEIITELNIWKPVHLAASISADANMALELVAHNNATATFDNIGLFLGNRISFDKDAKQCEAKDAGCREFARTINGANLIFNPSFEINEKSFNETAAAPDWYGWYGSSPAGSISRDEATKKSGKASLKVDVGAGPAAVIGAETPDPRDAVEVEYKLMLEDSYSFSVYAKAQTACAGNCLSLVGDCKVGAGGESQQGFQLSTSWERYSFNYKKSKIANDGNECRFFVQLDPSNTYWLDDAKLEIGNQSTNYKDYGSEKIYLNESRVSCDLSEVGCELYAPAEGGDPIPAVAKISDQCPAECAGYETYHEIPSFFDPEEDAVADVLFPNLIPKTAVQCSAQAAGCEEFTNLDAVAQGGEAKEYYAYLRQCAKPGTTTEATYYTWEGSEESGFQLRAWKFKAYADGSPFAIDSPLAPPADCDLSDPDCRVFYTQNGQPYQRLISKTVFISDDCHPLRRTVQGTRQDCENSGGRADPPGANPFDIVTCYYDAIPSQGIKCPAKEANCREYKGPQANNQKSLFKYDFEDFAQIGDWSIGLQSSESVSVGGYSLEVVAAPYDTERDVSNIVQKSKTYLVKFWAKPNPSNLDSTEIFAQFSDGSSPIDSGWITLLSDWNSYVLGPLDFISRDPGGVENLVINADEKFYIDNIELIEIANNAFVIKNSWTTPVSCDLNPAGTAETLSGDINETQVTIPLNLPIDFSPIGSVLIDSEAISYDNIVGNELYVAARGERGTTPSAHLKDARVLLLEPGYMLHCAAYEDRAENKHNLKSFSKLCREDHVGCELLADTQNTQNPFSEWKSAEFAPQDRLAAIVNNEKNYCDGKFKGCQKLGRPETDSGDNVTNWNTVYLINDPDNYKEILCQNIENWCREYKTPAGSEKYFKGPGQKLCEYKENIGVGGATVSGWFIKGQYDTVNPPECLGAIRHCSKPRGESYLFCRTNSDCQPLDKDGNPEDLGTCIAKDTEWVRECPQSQSSCTEYKDPLFSQTQGVKDRYYYLGDTIDESKCLGQIDEDQKCVAFNNTENPIMNVRTSGTCKADSSKYCIVNGDCPAQTGDPDDICLMISDKPFEPQACVRCSTDQVTCDPDPNKPNPCCQKVIDAGKIACDANTILYVQKDRDCREWLSCVSSAKITNAKGEKEDVCYDVARCTRINPTTGECEERATEKNYCQDNPAKACSSDSQCVRNEGLCDLQTSTCKSNPLTACAKDYECLVDEGPCIADGQTYDTPRQTDVPPHIGVVDALRNRSGFNPYGLHWTDSGQIREGEYNLTQTLQKGQVYLLEDGDFEKQNSAWSKFSTCSDGSLGVNRQCVNNSSCFSGDTCDLGVGTCTVSGGTCQNNNQCSVADSCGGTCSKNLSLRCRTNNDCGGTGGTCDLAVMECFVGQNSCKNDNGTPANPADDYADDSLCAGSDVCQSSAPLDYERLKAISGTRALKLGPGENIFQGNYPGATNFNDTKPIFVTGNSQIAFSGYINTVDLKSGEARVIIQEFKNGAKAFEYAKAPTMVMKQNSGKAWSFYAGIFTVHPETVSIRIVLEVDSASSGQAYFDNFLMLPVLNYQNQSYPLPFLEVFDPDNTARPGLNPFIGRSCRLYPQTSAPSCFYTDEQKQQFLGWRGFCVEPDPVNPLHCLQWLPIDQLQGEVGLGFKTESSYSGRTPLYYCAEMSLWQLRCNYFEQKKWSKFKLADCPDKSSVDPSCPSVYAKGMKCLGSKLSCLIKANRRRWCNVVGTPGPTAENTDRDCFWVPYASCPYGKDSAKDISPNLIGRCDKLIEVVDNEGQNIAWTDRLDQKSFQMMTPYGYDPGVSDGYVYTADQNNPLYGSILVMGQSTQSPDKWQTMFTRDFISLGGAARKSQCPNGQECRSVGSCDFDIISMTSKCNAPLSPLNGILCTEDHNCSECYNLDTDAWTSAQCDAGKNDFSITRSDSGNYPLWIVPKSEDNVYWCSSDQMVFCNPAKDPCPALGKGTCVSSGEEMACVISQGGSPLACSSPYCYNANPRTPPNSSTPGYQDFPASPWCAVDPITSAPLEQKQSFELNVTQATRSAPTKNPNKTNKETFIEGAQRLQHLFAKSYSSWVWNTAACVKTTTGANFCSGYCNISTSIKCAEDAQCPAGENCVSNEETGSSCDPTNNGDDDCSFQAGQCTPGVCMEVTAPNYVNKVCSATCMNGSCVPVYKCSVTGDDCSVDPCDVPPAGNVCLPPVYQCDSNSVNPGMACNPIDECAPVSICPGEGICGDWDFDIFTPDTCNGGERNGSVCAYTPVCTDKRCKTPGIPPEELGFCIDNNQCETAEGETCGPMSASPVCYPGGYQGACVGGSNDGGECASNADCPGGLCDLSKRTVYDIKSCTSSAGYCNITTSTACSKNSDCLSGEYCVSSECPGTAEPPINVCQKYERRCALQKSGSGLIGMEKAGIYCNDVGADINGDLWGDDQCKGIGQVCDGGDNVGKPCIGPIDCPNGGSCVADSGVCAKDWCEDGVSVQMTCDPTVSPPECSLPGAQPYSYAEVANAKTNIVNPMFAKTLWDPAFGKISAQQCPANKRPYAYGGGAPTGDIIAETGELCGVAPRITNFQIGAGGRSNQTFGDLKIKVGDSVTISFNTLIDAQQRPIRQIAVDWGDPLLGTEIKHLSSGDGVGLASKTLKDDPFVFTSLPYLTASAGYEITVMVQDNWYWCNAETDGKGCYANTDTGGQCQAGGCGKTDNWLPFPGKIIVE